MAVARQAEGSAVNTVTTTLSLVAPAAIDDDIFLVNIVSGNNGVIVLPQGWTRIRAFNNTADMRQETAWFRAGSGDSGATFAFTVPGTTPSFGIITSYRGTVPYGSPVGSSSQSANASSDTVTYATISPRDKFSLIVALGAYNLGATTAGDLSGTLPTFTNRVDAEAATGSLFVYDGLSLNGVATGERTHDTTSTVDAVNTGVLLELLAPPPGGYPLQSAGREAANFGYRMVTRPEGRQRVREQLCIDIMQSAMFVDLSIKLQSFARDGMVSWFASRTGNQGILLISTVLGMTIIYCLLFVAKVME